LHIAPLREDGVTYGTLTWIWSVVVDGAINDLIADAYRAKYHGSPYLKPMIGARAAPRQSRVKRATIDLLCDVRGVAKRTRGHRSAADRGKCHSIANAALRSALRTLSQSLALTAEGAMWIWTFLMVPA
jgi:hypothetical protein